LYPLSCPERRQAHIPSRVRGLSPSSAPAAALTGDVWTPADSAEYRRCTGRPGFPACDGTVRVR
jgi:hypothetical protein